MIMKKILFTMALAFSMLTGANADYFDYFTVEKSDGLKTSYVSVNLVITFSGSKMIVEHDGASTSYDLNTLSKMYFGYNDVTAIQNHTDETTDGRCEVFDLQGRRVATEMRISDAQQQLPKGVYIMKKGEKSVKITVK